MGFDLNYAHNFAKGQKHHTARTYSHSGTATTLCMQKHAYWLDRSICFLPFEHDLCSTSNV